jgi:hypothetical protein
VLSAIIEENIPIKVSSKLGEILFDYTPDRSKFLYKVLLNEERYSAFLNLAEECLLTVPKDVWPAKWNIFVRYNNQLSYSQWITFVQKLVVSKDGMNSQIGALILELLQPSHDRRLPRFKGLKTLLPKEIHEWLSGLFGKT